MNALGKCLAAAVAAACGLSGVAFAVSAQAQPAGATGASAQDNTAAQTANPAASKATGKQGKSGKIETLETVQVIGTRRIGRVSETDSIQPVDILPMAQSATQGQSFDLAQTLKYKVPSLVTQRTSGDDQQDAVDTVSLRGLDSDQTLVLINGKRYHQSSLIGLPGAGTNNIGAAYYDINTIPILAIDNVQVLRDGAAAQYGSDAIAGVVDIQLKHTPGCEGITGYGQYAPRGDGQNYIASAYCGFKVGDGGVISVTGEWQNRGRSDVAEPWNPALSDRPLIGDASVNNNTLYTNGDIPFANGAHFYFDGGIQNRYVSTDDFGRGGIGSGDIPSRNSAAMYPNGFVPIHDIMVQDRNGTVGAWWLWDNWRVDVSQTGGYNRLMNTEINTLNASLAYENLLSGGPGTSPTSFRAGGLSFRQYTSNLDVSRFFDNWLHGVNVAFGAEYRDENFKIYPGEPASYLDYDPTGTTQGGAQGFPGFQPGDATNKSRTSEAVYADIETDWTDRLRTDQAVRFEHYSDFGSTTIGKLSAAYNVTPDFMLRGSVSTGFRAPALQQRYMSSTISNFVNGQLVNTLLAPNGGYVAQAAGIPPLKQEKSRSLTLGLTWTPTPNTAITLDGYRIDIDDRIVLSGLFGDDDPVIGGILTQLGVGDAQFIVNGANTRTQGVDLTIGHDMALGAGHLHTFLAFNHTETSIRQVRPPASLAANPENFLPLASRLFITGAGPRYKMVLSNEYTLGKWDANFNIIWFGPITTGGAANDAVQRYNSKASADASVAYHFTPKTTLTIGGQNIFDVYPTPQNPNITANGFKYESVQFGLDGAAWFVRLAHKF